MDLLSHDIVLSLESFARSGGGGSGGGDSNGGGIEIALGYLPMHFVGAFLAKAVKKSPTFTVPANIAGWIIATIYAWFWVQAWPGFGFIIAIAALIGMPAGLYGWFGKLKQSKLVKGQLKTAAANDAAWDEQKLTNMASAIFLRYQKDWSNLDAEAIRAYATPAYQHHAALLLYTLKLMGRKNTMEDVQIEQAAITSANDAADNNQDSFTVGFTARANDTLVEAATMEPIFSAKNSFTEYWHFVRSGQGWLLSGISQATANSLADNAGLQAFAAQNGYFYSQDMGWLFIPKRGQLFGGAKFGASDINNHVVGLYNNQLLVQLYSYVKDPQNHSKPFVVAQVNVPRQYGNIVVRRNKLIQAPIFGLKKVETEWTQFNKKYEVFASSEEQATSFELLNPTYMEQLEALPFEVNIEVVDNVVYLHTTERGTDAATYQALLDLTNKAFKEMRL